MKDIDKLNAPTAALWIVAGIVFEAFTLLVDRGGVTTNLGAALAIASFPIGVALYFAPLICAKLREQHNIGVILLVNLFLGWTLVGWVVALAFAFADRKEDVVQPAGPEMKCPMCAEMVKAEAKICRFCGHEFKEELACES